MTIILKSISGNASKNYTDVPMDEQEACIQIVAMTYTHLLNELLLHITNKLDFRFNTVNLTKSKYSEIQKIYSKYATQGFFRSAVNIPSNTTEHDLTIAINVIKKNHDFFSAPFVTPHEFQSWGNHNAALLSSLSDGLLNFLQPSNQMKDFKFILIGADTDISCFKPNVLRAFLLKPINENLVRFLVNNQEAHEQIINKWRKESKVSSALRM